MTLSFFSSEWREALAFCGRNSGRDVDKAENCGLTPVFAKDNGKRSVYFDEASCVMTLRKMYADSLETSCFSDEAPLEFYRTDGLHKMYVCEITSVLVRE